MTQARLSFRPISVQNIVNTIELSIPIEWISNLICWFHITQGRFFKPMSMKTWLTLMLCVTWWPMRRIDNVESI